MLKKKFIYLFLTMCILVFSLSVISCKDVEKNVSFEYLNTSSIMNSEGTYQFFEDKWDMYKELSYDEVPLKYDVAFFETWFLIAFRLRASAPNALYEVESYSIYDSLITINVKSISKGDVNSDNMIDIIFFLEISKEKRQDIEFVQIFKDGTDVTRTKNKEILLYPSSPTELNKDKILEVYNKMTNSSIEVKGFYNYMPQEYSEEYKFDAIEIVDSNDESNFFIYYDGQLVRASTLAGNNDCEFKGFVHFAITDCNNDGFYELFSSMHLKNNIERTYISLLDSKIKKGDITYHILNDYAFFHNSIKNGFSIYTSNDNNIEHIDTHFITLNPNELKVNFKENEYMLESDNYFVKIKFDRYLLDIAVGNLAFSCNAIMTYTGETFTYTSPFTYLEGASVDFIDGENSMNSNFAFMDAAATYTVETNQVIDRTYTYYPQKAGTYDMKVSYRGETIIVEDVLIIE